MIRWRRAVGVTVMVVTFATVGTVELASNLVDQSSAGEGTGRVTVVTDPGGRVQSVTASPTSTAFSLP